MKDRLASYTLETRHKRSVKNDNGSHDAKHAGKKNAGSGAKEELGEAKQRTSSLNRGFVRNDK